MNRRAVRCIRHCVLPGPLPLEEARWERFPTPNTACHDDLLLLAPTNEI